MGKSTISMAMFNHNYGKSLFLMGKWVNQLFLWQCSIITMENHCFLMGKSTISMAMFNHNCGNHCF